MRKILLLASGDARASANNLCWPTRRSWFHKQPAIRYGGFPIGMDPEPPKTMCGYSKFQVRLPAEHNGGWDKSHGYRQAKMYFAKGGSTLSGISKAGEIVWARIYVDNNELNMDMGRGEAIDLPMDECKRRLDSTTPVWPLMNAVIYGVSRDQLMAKHQANHIQVVYASCAEKADTALLARAAMASELNINVNLCGTRKGGATWTQP